MPHVEELFASTGDRSVRPSFEVALRGYDKRQVDRYVAELDSKLSIMATEGQRAFYQLQDLTAQLEQAQAELVELRQRPPQLDRATFRDLGPTVDQILALAEKQAQEITDAAAHRAADQQAESERVLTEARQLADRLRTESEAAYEQAREQTEQEVRARQEVLAQLHAELDAAEQQLHQSRRESAAAEQEISRQQQRLVELNQELAGELDRLEQTRRAADSADRHAAQVRARVQREAERVAQLAAAAVMAAAERGGETGEYPMVAPSQLVAPEMADEAAEHPPEPAASALAPAAVAPAPAAVAAAPATVGGEGRQETD